MNTLTDKEIEKAIYALARTVDMAADNLENRQADKRRCHCNADGMPGLCAYHASAYEQLREVAQKLEAVRAYLERGPNANAH